MWQNPSGLLDGSGVSREVHAPFCERLRVKSPRPTLQIPGERRLEAVSGPPGLEPHSLEGKSRHLQTFGFP